MIENRRGSVRHRRSGITIEDLQREIAQLRANLKEMSTSAESVFRRMVDKNNENDIRATRNIRFEMARIALRESADFATVNMAGASSFSHPDDTLNYALSIAPVGGLALEFGVYQGGTLRKIAAARGDAHVYGFDSFQGLPEAWRTDFPAGAFAIDQLPEVGNAELVIGWFNQTLPGFLQEHPEPVDFLHIDCDLYSSTRTVFDYVGPRLRAGSVVLFDEFFNYVSWREHEFKAWTEYVEQSGVRFNYEAFTFNNEQVAVRILETSVQP